MLKINIEQNFGQIGISTTPTQLRIVSREPKVDVKTQMSAVQVDINWPAVKIDQTAAQASMGYKPIVPFEKSHADKGQSEALKAIAQKAQEGDQLAKVEQGGNPFVSIAAAAYKNKECNIALMPSVPPDIYFAGGIDIKANRGHVNVESLAKLPEISATDSSIEFYLKVKPSIDIRVVGQAVDFLT